MTEKIEKFTTRKVHEKNARKIARNFTKEDDYPSIGHFTVTCRIRVKMAYI